ncbi:hypothetical protein DBR11_16100 [Pedobacter sp. HMWF019]|uniref:TlpA family protein disulfide reductase n=1 Tax=Pedobacter sp. HMWF019 TaxID=2056856 RepID=UPI000D393B2E|nr:TlpA disulfide reductase family protein [Pedobacter sp. HMWF019]PTS97988.1 hypothetical protein DBR11_16100 [Pedobacter sp. HMWF019]
MRIRILVLLTAILFAIPAAYSAKIKGSRIGATEKSSGFFVEAYTAKGRVLFKSLKFNEKGEFNLEFPNNEVLIYWIDNFPVYVRPNDDLEIILPEKGNSAFVIGGPTTQTAATPALVTENEVKMAGKPSINNLLINQINTSWSSFGKNTGQQTVATINNQYRIGNKLIEDSKDPGLNNMAKYYNNIRCLESKLQYLRTHPAEKLDKSFFDVASKISLNNPSINSFKPIGIRALVANYYMFLKLSEGANVKDEDLTDNASLGRMRYLLKNVNNERVINEELNQSIVYHLSIKGWNPELDKIMASALSKVTDPEVKKNLSSLRDNYSKVSKNSKAPDFAIPDATGKLVNLHDFSGKILAIDVWATWCIPCMHSLPYFLNLREKYKDNPNVVFMSISIDNEASKDKWLNFLQSKNMNGVDLHAGDKRSYSFEKAYNITGIPRYILIDREGKIIEDHAVQASEPAYEALIETALKSK